MTEARATRQATNTTTFELVRTSFPCDSAALAAVHGAGALVDLHRPLLSLAAVRLRSLRQAEAWLVVNVAGHRSPPRVVSPSVSEDECDLFAVRHRFNQAGSRGRKTNAQTRFYHQIETEKNRLTCLTLFTLSS